MGDLSDHFSLSEFSCGGRRLHGHPDHLVVVDRKLVEALERLRELGGGRPLKIVSGHRCEWYNSRVGGATASQHLKGMAADIPVGLYTVDQASRSGFRGIGSVGRWAKHVDVRRYPARWEY